MAYSVLIAGVDRTSDVVNQSVVVEDTVNEQASTCRLTLVDLSGSGIPDTDDEIIITLASGTILFAGYIISLSQKKKGLGEIQTNISCVDYTRLLDRNLVHKSYEDMTDLEIIEDILDTYCAGFGITTNNATSGATIDKISFNYIQPSRCISRLAKLTGRNWYIDYEKDIHYFPLTTDAAPFNISDDSTELISETFASTPSSGTLSGSASYISASKYVRLTSATGGVNGALEYTVTVPSTFTAEMEVWAGGGSGADAVYFYWGASSTPTSEDTAIAGYLLALDEYSDELQLKFNGTNLTTLSFSNLDNSSWRRVKILFSPLTVGNNIKVYIDNTLYINHNDTTARTLSTKMGMGARTGGSTNEHRVKYLQVSVAATDYADLQISKDASQIKNRIYVRGGTKLSDPTTYSEKGDGEKTKFVLPDKPHDVTVDVNGTPQTLGIKNVDLSGFDWYVNFQEKYLEQDAGGVVLTSSDTINVTYSYDIPILVAQEGTTSIADSGVHEFAIFDTSLTTTQAARDRAVAELTDYAMQIVEGSFTTFTAGFLSGQYININLTDYDINDDYVIQKVTARSFGAGNYTYEVKIASAKTMGIIKFLIELLEENRGLVQLDDNEAVDELFSISDSLLSDSLTESLTIDSSGAYFTWSTSSETSPITRARWDLFQWG